MRPYRVSLPKSVAPNPLGPAATSQMCQPHERYLAPVARKDRSESAGNQFVRNTEVSKVSQLFVEVNVQQSAHNRG